MIFHTSYKNVCCDPSLEPSHPGGSIRSHNICFHSKIEKIISELLLKPHLIWNSAKKGEYNIFFQFDECGFH